MDGADTMLMEHSPSPLASLIAIDNDEDEDEAVVCALRRDKFFRDLVGNFLKPSPNLLTDVLMSKESPTRKKQDDHYSGKSLSKKKHGLKKIGDFHMAEASDAIAIFTQNG